MQNDAASKILAEMTGIYGSRQEGQIKVVLKMSELNTSHDRAIELVGTLPLHDAWKTFRTNSNLTVKRAALDRIESLLRSMLGVAKNTFHYAEIIRGCDDHFAGIKDIAFEAGLKLASKKEEFLELFETIRDERQYEFRILERHAAFLERQFKEL